MKNKDIQDIFDGMGTKTQTVQRRPYLRYTLILLLTMLVAFSLFTTAFTATVTGTLNEQRVRQLSGASDTLTFSLQSIDLNHTNEESRLFAETLLLIAEHLTGAYAWIVAPTGEIVYISSIPDYLRVSLSYSVDSGLPVLSPSQIGTQVPDEGLSFTGNYLGLFPLGRLNWISTVEPIFDENNERIAYLHLHAGVDVWQDARFYLINGLAVTVLVSLAVAMIFAWLFGRRLMQPLAQLSEAAERVAKGDLTVNVDTTNRRYRVLDEEVGDENEMSRLFKTFNMMVERLNYSNEEQRMFIASITHDLRTPITSVKGFVEGMLDGTIPPELYSKYLGIVQKEVDRLATLVSEMNDVVLLEGEAVRYDMQPFQLFPLIHDTVDSLKGLLLEKGITVQTNFASEARETIRVLGDRTQLSKVFYNLISNAIKFTPDEGVIVITAHLKKNSISISVEDSGPGIDEEDLPFVFDRFYKSDRSRTGNSGSGLGLYICRVVLQAHGQSITADPGTELGGAKFSFDLPLPQGRNMEQTKRKEDKENPSDRLF